MPNSFAADSFAMSMLKPTALSLSKMFQDFHFNVFQQLLKQSYLVYAGRAHTYNCGDAASVFKTV